MKKTVTILFTIFAFSTLQAQENKFNLIVGTYTKPCDSKGIYVYEFDSNTGGFSLKSNTENIFNPSYLSVSNDNKFVYSVSENDKKSSVSAFGYNSKSGKLDFINYQNPNGLNPCYIINDDKNVITANYSSGNISVLGKNNDGSIGAVKQVVQHTGKSINAKRQEAPHAHMVYFSPDKKYVLANDLGTDKIYVYEYNSNSATEVLQLKSSIDVKPGSGPRHLIVSKDGKYVYVLQELDGTITSFSYTNGMLKKVSETKVVSPDFKGDIGAADIHISPDGKFLYATNRGTANDISAFKILKKGKLEFVQRTSTLGKGPRNFNIDPTGNFLLVGHQYTNEIVIFKRDKTTGMLTNTGKKIDLCSPVCLVFTKI
ncbi:lactonase family protein [Flavobacterium franklandianum]|uniref:Lactonase family protein n=1 Tax=Flavobacterium franklandianum TaxID=2594430 RepID=A0A553CNK8_9FLAO|nr:lactonase family protein [Flavobacterium franklandianum]TRX22112.1 lactonase family protein [Flavobacterium franklandianum]TRX28666.1 lactonase family protein [Flavobacterium franklandianum]